MFLRAERRKQHISREVRYSMSQPRYLQIVQQLRDRIQNGEYPPNTRIPTENELSVSMGVSRPTVRQALNLLEQEGRLTRVKGSGTYVTEPKIQHESTRFVIGYQEESRERHNHLHTSVLALQKEKPGKLAAKALGLAEGERVTRMVRLRWLEGMYNGCAGTPFPGNGRTKLYGCILLRNAGQSRADRHANLSATGCAYAPGRGRGRA